MMLADDWGSYDASFASASLDESPTFRRPQSMGLQPRACTSLTLRAANLQPDARVVIRDAIQSTPAASTAVQPMSPRAYRLDCH